MLNKKLKIFSFFLIILLASLLVANNALAALGFSDLNDFLNITAGGADVSRVDIATIVINVIQTILGLVSVGFFILFIYGGFKWMIAKGNKEQIIAAKKTIINAVIGLAIVITAYSITYFISQAIETAPSTDAGQDEQTWTP